MKLSVERLRQIFDYDPHRGCLIYRINGSRYKRGQEAGYPNGRGHLTVFVQGRRYGVHRLIWFHVYGRWPLDEIDHKDGNGTNNRLDNLRECSHFQNQGNLRKWSKKKLPKGVSKFKNRNRNKPFIARIKINYKQIHLGTFATAEDAHAAYLCAAKNYFGEFARAE